jgi:hypothetical protein
MASRQADGRRRSHSRQPLRPPSSPWRTVVSIRSWRHPLRIIYRPVGGLVTCPACESSPSPGDCGTSLLDSSLDRRGHQDAIKRCSDAYHIYREPHAAQQLGSTGSTNKEIDAMAGRGYTEPGKPSQGESLPGHSVTMLAPESRPPLSWFRCWAGWNRTAGVDRCPVGVSATGYEAPLLVARRSASTIPVA